MGNVCQASLGQAPARQATLFAGFFCTIILFVLNYNINIYIDKFLNQVFLSRQYAQQLTKCVQVV